MEPHVPQCCSSVRDARKAASRGDACTLPSSSPCAPHAHAALLYGKRSRNHVSKSCHKSRSCMKSGSTRWCCCPLSFPGAHSRSMSKPECSVIHTHTRATPGRWIGRRIAKPREAPSLSRNASLVLVQDTLKVEHGAGTRASAWAHLVYSQGRAALHLW